MTTLTDLAAMLQDTSAARARLERALAVEGQTRSLALVAKSLAKRQEVLETSFLEEANRAGVDVCSYRIFTEDNPPRAASLGRALDNFQSMVSVVYSAVKGRAPRRGGRLPADDQFESSLAFGYSFTGSVGFVLTLANDRLLLGESNLDQSMSMIFDIAQAENPEDIAKYAEVVGPQAIRAVYRWSKSHASARLGADIEWQRDQDVRSKVFLDVPQIDHLVATIEATSEAEEEQVNLSAMLVGLHSERGTFDLVLEGGSHIRGNLGANVSLESPATVPARYQVWLTKVTRTKYSTDADEVTWTLDRMERP